MKCPTCGANNLEDSRFCSKCGTPIHSSDEILVSHTRTILRPLEEIPSGTILADKYKIIKIIGRGGMGIVYKAEDLRLKRHVALKFLPPELMRDEEAKERFALEAQAAAALSHPNICTIHEIAEDKGKPFIVMEFIDGQNLSESIKKDSLDLDVALDIAIQIAEGLDEANKKGIIHRDIKSANIMVNDQGQTKIMDFGLAKVKGGTLLTREGTTLGTVAFMSPEQARGENVDHRTDIWSLGVILYQMFSGQLPFMGDREESVLYSVVHEEPKPLKEIMRDIPQEILQIINRALKKKLESRYASATEMLNDLKKYQDVLRAGELGALSLRAFLRRIRKPQIAIPTICGILAICFVSIWFFSRQAKINWAKQEALPEIGRLIEFSSLGDYTDAYKLAETAEKYIPKNPELAECFSICSLKININTEPSGANIYIKEYKTPNDEWEYLGVSPLENIRLPVGVFRWKIEKLGHETVLLASSSWDAHPEDAVLIPNHLSIVLDEEGIIPPGMVRVTGAETIVGKLDDFYIDRYEVTNRQYKDFVDSGGYRNREYWKFEFIKDERILTWEDAMTEFVDQTGRPGPATWQAGDYPEGQSDYPVSGVSWYEAAAYAESSRKSLPTGIHWGVARGEYTPLVMWPQLGGNANFVPFSNFMGVGPVPVGSLSGITSYGAYDMAGNVREWCFNETQEGRLIRGGAWNDNTYMFVSMSHVSPFDRSSKNGFRCAIYPDPERIPESAFQMITFGEALDFSKEKPVEDPIYQVYKEQFSYDKTDLNARIESRDEGSEDWILEKITLDAAYGGEQIIAFLFLPKNIAPPYQTVIYFPGSGSTWRYSSEDFVNYYENEFFLSFIVKNDRAALYPVYKGTFERGDQVLTSIIMGDGNSHQYTELNIQLVKDFKRCIDYLETRSDIDSERLAYYGMSWGGDMGVIIPAVEERLKASILLSGGLSGLGRPEVNQINYITRVKTPTLMLNGKYDSFYPYETSIKPMFDLLGTPDEHKQLKMYDTDHLPPRNEFIKETLAWLDRYLGSVSTSEE